MMFLLENRDFPRSYFIPGRCEKTPHRHETTRKQKGTTMSRHVLFTLTLLTVNMDAENWENVRMCDVSGFCYFFFSFGGLSVHVGIGHPKNTKCAFICSIHVSVTYVKVPLTWMLKHVLLNNIQTWTFRVGFWASGRWAAVVSATSMIRSLDTPEKKRETRHVSGTGVFDGSHILQCFANMDAPRITGYLSLGATGNLQKIWKMQRPCWWTLVS